MRHDMSSSSLAAQLPSHTCRNFVLSRMLLSTLRWGQMHECTISLGMYGIHGCESLKLLLG